MSVNDEAEVRRSSKEVEGQWKGMYVLMVLDAVIAKMILQHKLSIYQMSQTVLYVERIAIIA